MSSKFSSPICQDEYVKNRNMQIAATKFWINTFFPIPEKLKEQNKEIQNFTKDIEQVNTGKANVLNKKVVY